jgi:hypothetical protein
MYRAVAPVNAALLVPEELGLEQVSGMAAQLIA